MTHCTEFCLYCCGHGSESPGPCDYINRYKQLESVRRRHRRSKGEQKLRIYGKAHVMVIQKGRRKSTAAYRREEEKPVLPLTTPGIILLENWYGILSLVFLSNASECASMKKQNQNHLPGGSWNRCKITCNGWFRLKRQNGWWWYLCGGYTYKCPGTTCEVGRLRTWYEGWATETSSMCSVE